MKFSNHIKHKTKPKLLLLSLLLTLSMIVPMLEYNTMDVYALPDTLVKGKPQPTEREKDEKNETGTDTTGGDSTQQESSDANQYFPNWDKTGWLFYVCDSNRQLLTPVLFFTGTNRSPSSNYDPTYLTSRIGNQKAVANKGKAPWGAPVTDKGSNWRDVKQKMDDNGINWVADYFGDTIAQEVRSNPQKVHVILETVSWHYKSDRSSSKAVASCSGWARMAQEGKCKIGQFSWYPFNKIAVSEYLEYEWLGLEEPPPKSIIHP